MEIVHGLLLLSYCYWFVVVAATSLDVAHHLPETAVAVHAAVSPYLVTNWIKEESQWATVTG